MTAKKKTMTAADAEQAEEQVTPDNTKCEEENAHVEQSPETPNVQKTFPDSEKDVAAAAPQALPARKAVHDDGALESLSVLADRHRIPAWMDASLRRYMGWEDGKMVTDALYRDALDKFKTRRLGGGRVE